jgi:hypothetical protein
MAIYEELCGIHWSNEFVVEYADGRRERLLRGDGVGVIPPADDPEGYGALCAALPKRHPRSQKQCERHVRFTELRAIYSPDGRLLWPDA